MKNIVTYFLAFYFYFTYSLASTSTSLPLPEGVSSTQTLFLQLRSGLKSKIEDLYKNYSYRAGAQSIEFLENILGRCGELNAPPGELLSYHFMSHVSGDKKIERIEARGCNGVSLYVEEMAIFGKNLKPTPLAILANGGFSEFIENVHYDKNDQPTVIVYTLRSDGHDLIEISQKRNKNILKTEFSLYQNIFTTFIDALLSEKIRKIEWIFPSHKEVQLPKISFPHIGGSGFNLGRFGFGTESALVIEVLLRDQGMVIPFESYTVNGTETTRKGIVDHLNGNTYSMLKAIKDVFYQSFISGYLLPKTEALKSAGDSKFLTEIKELLRFIDQPTPPNLFRIRTKLIEFRDALVDGIITTNDKRKE